MGKLRVGKATLAIELASSRVMQIKASRFKSVSFVRRIASFGVHVHIRRDIKISD